MVNLNLEQDEGILLQSSEILFYGEIDEETEIDELLLTNKNLICVIDKSIGLFKSEKVAKKIPLTDIKVVDGQAQIMEVSLDFGDTAFQILYTNGKRERYIFPKSARKEIPVWINRINQAVTGKTEPLVEPPAEKHKSENKNQSSHKKDSAEKSAISDFASELSGLKNAFIKAHAQMTSISQQIPEIIKEKATPTDTSSDTQSKPNSENESFGFCSACGSKLSFGAKFCSNCGNPINGANVNAKPTPEINYENAERRREFAGKVLKCPNCGSPISETTAICPDCGMYITGKNAISSVRDFTSQLMNIENTRKTSGGGILGMYFPADKADLKKLELIKNYPIPNTVDDVFEFITLAIANIDVSLSKKTLINRQYTNTSFLSGANIGHAISNAWVAKMEQLYHKAEISFPNDPVFEKIQKMYYDKMKELKLKIK